MVVNRSVNRLSPEWVIEDPVSRWSNGVSILVITGLEVIIIGDHTL